MGKLKPIIDNLTDVLSSERGYEAAQEAPNTALGKVEAWRTSRVGGIEAQIAAAQSALLAKAGKAVPEPSPMRVQTLAMRRCGDGMDDAMDPLEIRALYATAAPEDQRAIEVVAEQIGRQPMRRNGQMTWEPLLDSETVSETVLARADQFDQAGAAALRDLMRIRNAYVSVAASARTLVENAINVAA